MWRNMHIHKIYMIGMYLEKKRAMLFARHNFIRNLSNMPMLHCGVIKSI